jgi:hypothetical protein
VKIHPRCLNCGDELTTHSERVMEYCCDCIASDQLVEADAQSNWESFQNERNETVEGNQGDSQCS